MTIPESDWSEEELDQALVELTPFTTDASVAALADARAAMLAAAHSEPAAPIKLQTATRTRRWVPVAAAAACVVALTVTIALTRHHDGPSPAGPSNPAATIASPSEPSVVSTTKTADLPTTTNPGNSVSGPTFAHWDPIHHTMNDFPEGELINRAGCILFRQSDGTISLPIFAKSVVNSVIDRDIFEQSKEWTDQPIELNAQPWNGTDPVDAQSSPVIPTACQRHSPKLLVWSVDRNYRTVSAGPLRSTIGDPQNVLAGRTFRLTETGTDDGGADLKYPNVAMWITFEGEGAHAEFNQDGIPCGTVTYPVVFVGKQKEMHGLEMGEPVGESCALGDDPSDPPSGDLSYILDGGRLTLSTGFVKWIFEED